MTHITIGTQPIGQCLPCFVIAEAGVNHNGDFETALRLIEAAAHAGANAIKFQTFAAERVITKTAPKAAYQQLRTASTESQFAMLRSLELSEEDQRELCRHAQECGILFLSTPYSLTDAQLLQDIGVPAFKFSSIDIVNLPLLRAVAEWKKPLILSTGMADLGEIERGIRAVREAGNEQIILLQCTTNYPVQDNEVNLNVIETLRRAFQVVVGFSDHTVGWEIALAAVTLGASVIEKHFTLDRAAPGPDHAASLEPHEMAHMVRAIRRVEQALGSPQKQPLPIELENRKTMRRSLVAATHIPAGAFISEDMLALKRPGIGYGAEAMELFIGHKARVNIEADTLLNLDMVE